MVRVQPKADREVVLYGWLRGTNMRPGQRVHLAGVGDFSVQVWACSRSHSSFTSWCVPVRVRA